MENDKNKVSFGLILIIISIILIVIIAAIILIMCLLNGNNNSKTGMQYIPLSNNTTQSNNDKEEKENKTSDENQEDENKLPEINENTTAGTEVRKPESWPTNTKVRAIADGKGKIVPLPKDFIYTKSSVDSGAIVIDPNGNEFVWIPIDRFDDFIQTNWQKAVINMDDYKEPYGLGYSGETLAYNKMKKQIKAYSGFYIGRYESGVENVSQLRNSPTNVEKVVIKSEKAPCNFIPWGTSVKDKAPIQNKSGAVYLAEKFAKENGHEGTVSTLCYAVQWDYVMRFIENVRKPQEINELNHNGIHLTGAVKTDSYKNIYDLEGNCSEWTMEAYSGVENRRVVRGGSGTTKDALGQRTVLATDSTLENVSFRIALYLE